MLDFFFPQVFATARKAEDPHCVEQTLFVTTKGLKFDHVPNKIKARSDSVAVEVIESSFSSISEHIDKAPLVRSRLYAAGFGISCCGIPIYLLGGLLKLAAGDNVIGIVLTLLAILALGLSHHCLSLWTRNRHLWEISNKEVLIKKCQALNSRLNGLQIRVPCVCTSYSSSTSSTELEHKEEMLSNQSIKVLYCIDPNLDESAKITFKKEERLINVAIGDDANGVHTEQMTLLQPAEMTPPAPRHVQQEHVKQQQERVTEEKEESRQVEKISIELRRSGSVDFADMGNLNIVRSRMNRIGSVECTIGASTAFSGVPDGRLFLGSPRPLVCW